MPLSRRGLLGGAASAAVLLPGSSFSLSAASAPKRGRPPKNIIFCVADGMATSIMTMHDHLSQMEGRGRSYYSQLLDRPDVHRGWQDTRSLSSLVTDSAAASSAWGCGRHIWNAQLNVYPDGTELEPLMTTLGAKGVKRGLVTTTTITHATPAGFAISALDRDKEDEIADKYLATGIEVFLGGGRDFFDGKKRKDGKDLLASFAAKGYAVVGDKTALAAAGQAPLLGLFAGGHIPLSVDRDNDPVLKTTVPTLAEMASKAISLLKGSKEGFLLQIEGGRVDHGSHTNDIAAALYDQRAFEDAVKAAIEFAEKDGETLVIVTADHSTGGVALNGAGFEYADTTKGLQLVSGMVSSYAPILAALAVSPKPETAREWVKSRLNIELTAVEAQALADAAQKKFPYALSEFDAKATSVMGIVIGNHTKVGYTSGNHTSDHVITVAYGPWSDRVAGLQPNIGFHPLILATKGLKKENPTMSYEDAKRAFEKAQASVPPKKHDPVALADEGWALAPDHFNA